VDEEVRESRGVKSSRECAHACLPLDLAAFSTPFSRFPLPPRSTQTCTAKGIKPAATNLRAAVQELVQTLPAALLRAVEALRVPELARAAEHLAAFADLARDARTGAGDEAAQQSQVAGPAPSAGRGDGRLDPGAGSR